MPKIDIPKLDHTSFHTDPLPIRPARAALPDDGQGRDLFDLYHATTFGPRAMPARTFDGGRVIEAFNWYLENEGTQMGRDEAERRLSGHLADRSFRNDMRQLLRSDYGPYDVDAAADLVRVTYLAQLR